PSTTATICAVCAAVDVVAAADRDTGAGQNADVGQEGAHIQQAAAPLGASCVLVPQEHRAPRGKLHIRAHQDLRDTLRRCNYPLRRTDHRAVFVCLYPCQLSYPILQAATTLNSYAGRALPKKAKTFHFDN